MKKFILLTAFIVAGLGFTGCSSDDDNGSTNTNPQSQLRTIVGKWNLVQTGPVVNGAPVYTNYSPAEGCSRDFIEFTGTSGFKRGTHSVNGANACEEVIVNGSFIQEELDLKIIEGETAKTYLIRRLSDDRLAISTVGQTPEQAYHYWREDEVN